MIEINEIKTITQENIEDKQIQKELIRKLTTIHCHICDLENTVIRRQETIENLKRKLELIEKENYKIKKAIIGLIDSLNIDIED